MGQSFDVGDVSSSLTGSAVAAGVAGLPRSVERIVMASHARDLNEVQPSDLVITTAMTLASASETGRQLVERLDEAGIAGIAVQLDHQTSLEAELIAAADET